MCECAPKPFAIGVLGLAPGRATGQDRQSRLEVALRGYKLGYFMVDVVEVSGSTSTDEVAGYRLVEELATQTQPDAFVIQGPVDLAELQRVADRIRARIRCPPW